MPTVNLTAPTDYTAELANIDRQRKLADMLQQQAMAPTEQQTAGGYVIPVSWTQGLAKALQGYAGMKGQEAAAQAQKDLNNKAQTEAMDWFSAMPQAGIKNLNPVANDDEGNPLPAANASYQPSRMEQMAWALRGAGNPASAPIASMMAQQFMKTPESLFGKVDPKDYTPESIARFSTSQNFADLVPVRKKEVVSLGGVSRVVDPYSANPGDTLSHTISPDTQATLDQKDKQWQGLSTAQRLGLELEAGRLGVSVQQLMLDRAKLGNQNIETQFNTGSSAGMPSIQIPQIPSILAAGGFMQPGQPQQPAQIPQQAAPQSVRPAAPIAPAASAQPPLIQNGAITPKQQSEMNFTNAQLVQGAKKILQAAEYDPATKTDKISKLIDQSTSGVLQNYAANAKGALTGSATSGREAIGQLETLSTKLVMDLMGGKLGSGISNADRDFVVAQLGDVANANKPANERKAAWGAAIQRLNSIVSNASGGASGGWDGTDRRSNSRTIDFNSLPQGGKR